MHETAILSILWYINLDGSFDVLFDDGDRRTCLPAPLVRWAGSGSPPSIYGSSDDAQAQNNIKKKETINIGDVVRARFRGGWKYFGGKILKKHGRKYVGDVPPPFASYTYDVRYDDGEIEKNITQNA